ncbi:MAG: PKD domain-containing protein, partial [Thermoplasmata archaeon]
MSEEEPIPEPPSPPTDEELPPPPTDVVDESKDYPNVKLKKSKPLATLRRAFIIFEKDLRTMAKHGLVSAVILFVFLSIVFSIMSFSMKQAVQFKFEGSGDDGDQGIPGASGVNPPVASATLSPSGPVVAGTSVTLDASSSTDNSRIVYYQWSTEDGARDVNFYGPIAHFTFDAVGSYDVRLTVVDDEWNMNETSAHLEVTRASS